MIRKILLLLCATALTLAACGRQVTPDRAGTNGMGLAQGFMQVVYTTAQSLDFTNVRYVIVFNTSGTGGEPYAPYGNQANNYRDYSFAIVVGGNGLGANAQVIQFYREPAPGGGTQVIQLPVTGFGAQSLQFIQNGPTQFTVRFDRKIFYALQTPGPSNAPTATPTASPTPSASPSPNASPTPNAPPTTAAQQTWYINFLATDPQGNPLDAAGQGGAQDTSFVFSVDTTTSFDKQYYFAQGFTMASSPNAQIQSADVANNP